MIYTFSNSIFDNLNNDNLDLLDNVWSNSKGRHFLFIGNEQNFIAIKSSVWFHHQRQSNQDQIEQQFVASANIPKKLPKFTISATDTNCFSLTEASEVLGKSFTIVLENREYDAHFINAIINNYEEGRLIRKHYDKGWLIFGNGAGNNIVNEINGNRLLKVLI